VGGDREATAPETLAAVAAPRAGASETEAGASTMGGQRAAGSGPGKVSGTRRRRERRAVAERERIRRRRGSGGGGGGGEGASGGGIRARPARLGAAYSGWWWWYACARPERAPQDPAREEKKGKWEMLFFFSISLSLLSSRSSSFGVLRDRGGGRRFALRR